MTTTAQAPPVTPHKKPLWRRYVIESGLACAGSMFITGMIKFLHLYPSIPNISIIYLLVVMALASTRGRYAAILASIVAFLAFDFFLVHPVYTFTINRIEEWLALFIFLVTAILTSELTSALRRKVEQAKLREQETRTLYELVRAMNEETDFKRQLAIITETIVTTFSSWGVLSCAFLLPDNNKQLSIHAKAAHTSENILLSPDEQTAAQWVITHSRSVTIPEGLLTPSASHSLVAALFRRSITLQRGGRSSLHLIPLKIGKQTVGVLYLRLQNGSSWFTYEEGHKELANERSTFFRTFLDQATAVIEHERLHRENLRVEVLQRTDALRASLLSSVSHDLRTPLSSIKASASSLLQDDVQWDDETRHGFVQTIEYEADRLNRLVSNLLDMSRIEGGALKPEKEWYPLDQLLHDVLDRLHHLLHGRTVHIDIADNLPPIALDYLQIDQVFTNLLENAVRYTPETSPIDIRMQVQDAEIITSIADRGPGIPEEELERIFDKFYRVTSRKRTNKHPSGSGLGLAVCKGLVEAHGGRIWAEQRAGGGAVFYVALPITTQESGNF